VAFTRESGRVPSESGVERTRFITAELTEISPTAEAGEESREGELKRTRDMGEHWIAVSGQETMSGSLK
jgi:hypothetical protein